MTIINVRMDTADVVKLTAASKKAGMKRSEYIRRVLFDSASTTAKIEFYGNINQQMQEIVKQSVFTTQLLCQVLANQTDAVTVQTLIETIKNDLEDNIYEK